MTRRSLWVLLAAAAAPAFASQPIQARFTAGMTSFVEDYQADNHATVGGSVQFYFARRWSVEPEYLYMRTGDNHHDHVFWGNVAFDIRSRDHKFVPYWFAAPGVVRNTRTFGPLSFTSTEGAFSTGFGSRFFVSDRVFLAPQIRLGVADGFFGEVTGSIGFLLRK